MIPYLLLGLGVIATVFFISAISIPIVTTSNSAGDITSTFTIWKSCSTTSSKTECTSVTRDTAGCDDNWNAIVAGRAFGVLSILASGVFTIIAGGSVYKPEIALLPPVKSGLLLTSVAAVVTGLVYVALDFAYFFAQLCDGKALADVEGVKLGVSAPLAAVGCAGALIALIVTFIGRNNTKVTATPDVYNLI
jgi:hypothetical protein